jgi:rhamnose utilization protein RhaD (predicted bifunctional aldolase and dehydrogenase)
VRKSPPRELEEHAIKVGSDGDLVQISGGNVSAKVGLVIWVKASGKRLSNAENEDIFCQLKLSDYTLSELMTIEDFSAGATGELLPSIETNFHMLLPFKYVTHLHSLGSVALSLLNPRITSSDTDFGPLQFSFVEYATPGKELANKLWESDSLNSHIILLQNHGVIFTGDDLDFIEKNIAEAETNIKKFLAGMKKDDNYPDWIEILTGGILTPDEAVFLGNEPFLRSENPLEYSIAINSLGELLFPPSFSADKIQIANFYKRLACLVEKKSFINYLSRQEVRKILSWDKEKRRIEMSE